MVPNLLVMLVTLTMYSTTWADMWEYGGFNVKTNVGDDLYAFNMDIIQNYAGDIFLSDHSFQIAGPYMGESHEVWQWGSSSAPPYDDGFVHIENIRHVDQSYLFITKYPDRVHYEFRIEAWTFHTGHLWFNISVLGRRFNAGAASPIISTIVER